MLTRASSPPPTRRRFAVAEYHQMLAAGILAEDDRLELIAGEIIAMSPIGARHAARVNRLNRLLIMLTAGAAVVAVQNPVTLEDSEPQPDVALLRPRADDYAAGHPGPADVLLLVEVADTSAGYDREVKLPLYARAGVPVVWLLDLAAGLLEVHSEPSPVGYRQVRRAAAGERVALPGFPADTLDVGELLRD